MRDTCLLPLGPAAGASVLPLGRNGMVVADGIMAVLKDVRLRPSHYIEFRFCPESKMAYLVFIGGRPPLHPWPIFLPFRTPPNPS